MSDPYSTWPCKHFATGGPTRCEKCRSLPTRRPRLIRRVVKQDAKGRAKVARDSKAGIQMERVTARKSPRPCSHRDCPMPGQMIEVGAEYAKVTDHNTRDFHFDCVPPEARPLVRFLVPCNWHMEMYTPSDGVVFRWFTSPQAWAAWVDKTHPTMRKAFHRATNEYEQLGTNAYWSTLHHWPRFQKP